MRHVHVGVTFQTVFHQARVLRLSLLLLSCGPAFSMLPLAHQAHMLFLVRSLAQQYYLNISCQPVRLTLHFALHSADTVASATNSRGLTQRRRQQGKACWRAPLWFVLGRGLEKTQRWCLPPPWSWLLSCCWGPFKGQHAA